MVGTVNVKKKASTAPVKNIHAPKTVSSKKK